MTHKVTINNLVKFALNEDKLYILIRKAVLLSASNLCNYMGWEFRIHGGFLNPSWGYEASKVNDMVVLIDQDDNLYGNSTEYKYLTIPVENLEVDVKEYCAKIKTLLDFMVTTKNMELPQRQTVGKYELIEV